MRKHVRAVLFILCLVPLFYLIMLTLTGGLGANPIQRLTHFTGTWTLNFFMITLSVTPLRHLTGIHRIVQYRRMLGLYTFFYACLHFLCYFVLDQFFDLPEIIDDIVKRPYITVGLSAFLLLIPLAVTSTRNMQARLGKRWKKLHRLIYVSATLAVLHFLWLVKADIREPVIYGAILIVLLVLRVIRGSRGKLVHP